MRASCVLVACCWLGACRQSCAEGFPGERVRDEGLIDVHLHASSKVLVSMLGTIKRAGVMRGVLLSGLPWSAGCETYLSLAKQASARADIPVDVFCGVPWMGFGYPGFEALVTDELTKAHGAGAAGIKINKALGLRLRDPADGTLVVIDDERLNPLWDAAQRLGLPIAIHTGDPLAFFQPPTPDNERYQELKDHPSWSFYGADYPSLEELLLARDRVVQRYPKVAFVAVHVGGFPENLEQVAASMRKLPNLRVDIAARVPELGRQDPARVRDFFTEFQDRILFGSDLQVTSRRYVLGSAGDDETPTAEDALDYYRIHFRYLETNDQDFEHRTPIQGEWTISGIGLPIRVLRKVYHQNAQRLLGTVD